MVDLHADLVRHAHRGEDEEVLLAPQRKAAPATAPLVRDGGDEAAAAGERIVGAVVEAEAPFLLRRVEQICWLDDIEACLVVCLVSQVFTRKICHG